jgi:transcriptional regulator with XRE-family HTH domain
VVNSILNELIMSKTISESAKLSIAIKLARTALGLNQQMFADKLGVSKTTLARIETMEAKASFEFYMNVTKLINSVGVTFEVDADDILLRITPAAQQLAIETLADENNRRSDRKKTALCDS